MSDARSSSPARGSDPTRSVRCHYLATKTDYYRDPAAPLPEDPGRGETAVFWCILTSKSLGPDGGPCNREDCSAVRVCYRAGISPRPRA